MIRASSGDTTCCVDQLAAACELVVQRLATKHGSKTTSNELPFSRRNCMVVFSSGMITAPSPHTAPSLQTGVGVMTGSFLGHSAGGASAETSLESAATSVAEPPTVDLPATSAAAQPSPAAATSLGPSESAASPEAVIGLGCTTRPPSVAEAAFSSSSAGSTLLACSCSSDSAMPISKAMRSSAVARDSLRAASDWAASPGAAGSHRSPSWPWSSAGGGPAAASSSQTDSELAAFISSAEAPALHS
mmetsp:Transcript_68216/g.128839  ORF Transcript_68216/g.128839 Transcript_68216/m.128839 type:complete len:246 (-) Transcript_68216:381-1118(-)